MNRYLLASLVVAGTAVANVSFAGNHGEDWDPQPTFQGSRTRADVVAEIHQSRSQMTAAHGEDSGSAYLAARASGSGTTRADVTAEYLKSRNEVAAMNGEDSGSVRLAHARAQSSGRVQMAGDATRSE
jgi:hypothetical protein